MHVIDLGLVVVYLLMLLIMGIRHRLSQSTSVTDLIVGGRRLTLPALVASLVATWYGGILGVGEYSYLYGLSNWLVFGLPYYLAALIFAVFLAKRARRTQLLTIPDQLAHVYGRKTAGLGAVFIFLMTVPGAYVLMLGVLAEQLFGLPFSVGVIGGAIFSVGYVYLGGFRAVVRTDLIQFVLMFTGFIVMLVILVSRYGGFEYLSENLPATHLTWHGGNSGWYIATWYVIALATLVEPTFYQRCYAAVNEATARRGILVSICCWTLFDFLTTTCGLYARVLLPDLADPVSSYPALALQVLPVGLLGLFVLALLSTVMSTVDSYSFVAASTFGRDIMQTFFKVDESKVTRFTRLGLLLSTALSVLVALCFRSVVDIWHFFGSIGTPALLVPLLSTFSKRRPMRPSTAMYSMISCAIVSTVWYLTKYTNAAGDYWFSIEPIFPGLILSILIYITATRNRSPVLPQND
ncbi:MAG: sodium:solute symporter family protein [candidate division Zixibacteria bacterium]